MFKTVLLSRVRLPKTNTFGVLSLHLSMIMAKMFICDVISEKVPYCGRNSSCFYTFLSKLRRERDKCFNQMLISDKYRRPWSDAAHHARCLIRAYCSAIRSFFIDDVTLLPFLMPEKFNKSRSSPLSHDHVRCDGNKAGISNYTQDKDSSLI